MSTPAVINPTWFDTEEKRAALTTAAAAWLFTPFRANSAVRGPRGGVSCHNLVAEAYFAVGFLERFDVPRGSPRALQLHGTHPLIEYIDGPLADRFAAIDLSSAACPLSSVLPGDLLGFGKQNDVHVGIALPCGGLLHVDARAGVMISLLADATYAKRLRTIRRPRPSPSNP